MAQYRGKHINCGMALITMLLVMSLIITIISVQTHRTRTSIKLTKMVNSRSQAWQNVLSSESYARKLLVDDILSNSTDHLYEDWNKLSNLEAFNIADTYFKIEDLQGRININNLVGNDDQVNEAYLDATRAIFSSNNMDPDLLDAIIDWIDTNDTSRLFQTENSYYEQLTPPYSAANQSIFDVSELFSIKDLDNHSFRRIKHLFCSLPAKTFINVNTVRPEVSKYLAKNISAEYIQEERASKANGFSSVSDFLSSPSTAGVDFGNLQLTVSSEYFLVKSTSYVNDISLTLESTIYRSPNTKKTKILNRKISPTSVIAREKHDI